MTGQFDAVFDLDETIKHAGREIGKEIAGQLIEYSLAASFERIHRPEPCCLETERLVLSHRLIPSVPDEVFDGLAPKHFYLPWHVRMAEKMLPPAPPMDVPQLAAALDADTPYQAERWSSLLSWMEERCPALGEPERVRAAVVKLQRLAARRERVRLYDALAADARAVDLDDVQELERLRAIAAILKGQPAR